jgi:hypothetical protein
MWTLGSRCAKNHVLALFGSGQQFAELWNSTLDPSLEPCRYCGGFSFGFGFSSGCFFSSGARTAGCACCGCSGAGFVSAGGAVARWGCERSLGGGVCDR